MSVDKAIGIPYIGDMIDTLKIAEKLESFAREAGLSVEVDGSSLSSSRYLKISDDEETIKVRIADHIAKPTYEVVNGFADYEVGPHDMGATLDWEVAAVWIAKRFNVAAPAKIVTAAEAIKAVEAQAQIERQARNEHDAASTAASRAEKAARLEAARNDDRAARLAELEAKLGDQTVTGNRRKKIHEKIRALLGK